MSNAQKSFLIKGNSMSGKDILPKGLRDRGIRLNSYGAGEELRALLKARKTRRRICSETISKGGLVSDELIGHLVSERLRRIGNELPFFGIGLTRTVSQVGMILRILNENGFEPPTLIHLNYSIDYCRERYLDRLEEGVDRPDNERKVCERRWREYAETEQAILYEFLSYGLRIYTISDHDKFDHIDRYAKDLGLLDRANQIAV